MAALTKAEMAEALFDQLGLNKREARELVDLFSRRFELRYPRANKSSYRGLVISICGIRIAVLGAILKRVKKFPSAPVALSHSVLVRN